MMYREIFDFTTANANRLSRLYLPADDAVASRFLHVFLFETSFPPTGVSMQKNTVSEVCECMTAMLCLKYIRFNITLRIQELIEQ